MLLGLRLLLIWGAFRLSALGPGKYCCDCAIRLLRLALLLACGQMLKSNKTNNKSMLYVRQTEATMPPTSKRVGNGDRWWHRATAKQFTKITMPYNKHDASKHVYLHTNAHTFIETYTHRHTFTKCRLVYTKSKNCFILFDQVAHFYCHLASAAYSFARLTCRGAHTYTYI